MLIGDGFDTHWKVGLLRLTAPPLTSIQMRKDIFCYMMIISNIIALRNAFCIFMLKNIYFQYIRNYQLKDAILRMFIENYDIY